MTIKKKTLNRYHWDNISTFRQHIQEYLKSIRRVHPPRRHVCSGKAKNLSLSENSGYKYTSCL